jgi:probable HAF family extracellular repeat protein
VNGSAEVVGESNFLNSPFTFHAFRWTSGGGMVDLGTLSGGSFSIAYGINESGQIVGETDDASGQTRAFIWDSVGGMQDLGLLPNGTFATARAINAQGQVVGWGDTTGGVTRAFLWDPVAGFTDLGTLPGATDSFALGLNDLGQVVGQVFTPTGAQAFVWDATGGMQPLPTLTGATESLAAAINNAGQVAGDSDSATAMAHAVRWQLNRGPSAQGGNASTPQDTPVPVTLGGSDPDGDGLAFAIVTPPAHGTLSGVAPNLVYTPNPGWSGSDGFAFTVNDGALTSAPATVALTVVPADPAPVPDDLAGRIRGHGHLEGHHHFAFRVGKRPDSAPFGQLHYWHTQATTNHGKPHWRLDRFFATSITAATFSDDPALTPSKKAKPVVDTVLFTGTGRWNGVDGYTFEVQAADAGEPGRGRDSFAIVIKAPDGTIVANAGGTLAGGNVQSVPVKPAPALAAASKKK